MPNLEVHYNLKKLQKLPELICIDPKDFFVLFGKLCQEAVATAYNKVNKPSRAIIPASVLVRFIEASEYDVGNPDICFVIKCGRDGLTAKEQLHFCELFEDTIRWDFDCNFNFRSLKIDYEMFCKASHGFRRQGDQMIDQW